MIKVYLSYADEDAKLVSELRKHASLLERAGKIELSGPEDIDAHEELERAVKVHCGAADIVLFFISASFFHSKRVLDWELPISEKRLGEGTVWAVPVLLRPNKRWKDAAPSLAPFRGWPDGERAVTEHSDRDTVWSDIVDALGDLAEKREALGRNGPVIGDGPVVIQRHWGMQQRPELQPKAPPPRPKADAGIVEGRQYEDLVNALVSAFTPRTLERMLQFRLSKDLQALVRDGSLTDMVYDLIREANTDGWTAALVAAARESKPGNPALIAFSQQYGAGPRTLLPDGRSYELFVNEANSLLNPTEWRTRLGEIEGQVCCIELPSGASGTGFLVGPDLVMTNYHVVAPYAGRDDLAGRIALRFDYKALSDGTTISSGREYRLATKGWLVDFSLDSPVDSQVLPNKGLVDPDHLDYALLRCAGSPGLDPVGTRSEPGAPPRRWIVGQPCSFEPGKPLFILQHPRGSALRLALEMNGIIGVNENATRVRYRTNTDHGSSGAPCFDASWNLIALHHSGDPAFYEDRPATYNEGIPIGFILERLRRNGIVLANPPVS